MSAPSICVCGGRWTYRAVREGAGGRLLVETSAGTWSARALINATGTWDRPFWPRYPGQESFRGRQLHTAQYAGPGEFAGLRVVVVGGGASGTQHLMEIAPYAAATTWVTRRPPVFREGPFTEDVGRAAVALVEERVRQGLPPRSVVSVTGLPLNDAIRRAIADGVLDRQPMFDRIVPDGVEWDDGRHVDADVILWATGFRAAIDHLAPLRLRAAGAASGSTAPGWSPTRGSTWSGTARRPARSAPTGRDVPPYGTSDGCWRESGSRWRAPHSARTSVAAGRTPRGGVRLLRPHFDGAAPARSRLNSRTLRRCSS